MGNISGYLPHVPKFKDVRYQLKRHPYKRFPALPVTDKTTIALHHSLTRQHAPGSNAEGYAVYHVEAHDWPGIGYNYVIEPDGTIKFCNELALRNYHVGNHNNYCVGICLTGDFRYEEPANEQKDSLRRLIKALQKEYPFLKYVKGHHEFSGYEWKQCQEFDYKTILQQKGPIADQVSLPAAYTIQEGDTLWSIAKGLESLSVTDLIKANPRVDPGKLKIGQQINLGNARGVQASDVIEETGTIAGIQSTINLRYGYSISVDNITGPQTLQALLMAYQTELNKQFDAKLKTDGIWGPETAAVSVKVSIGAKGKLTWILQAVLYCKGYPLTVDGIFGQETVNTVKTFQKASGIQVDGIAGPVTFWKLFS